MKNYILTIFFLLSIFSCSQNHTPQVVEQIPLISQNEIESQHFNISNDRDTTIFGKKGTQIRIEQNTFVNETGEPIKGKIQLELKEALTITDIVLGNLTTTANGQYLQSGGMLFLGATAMDNEKCQIASDKALYVDVPAEKIIDDMQLYEGELQADSSINWINPVELVQPSVEKGGNSEKGEQTSREIILDVEDEFRATNFSILTSETKNGKLTYELPVEIV